MVTPAPRGVLALTPVVPVASGSGATAVSAGFGILSTGPIGAGRKGAATVAVRNASRFGEIVRTSSRSASFRIT
jgi:hypothetical protein